MRSKILILIQTGRHFNKFYHAKCNLQLIGLRRLAYTKTKLEQADTALILHTGKETQISA